MNPCAVRGNPWIAFSSTWSKLCLGFDVRPCDAISPFIYMPMGCTGHVEPPRPFLAGSATDGEKVREPGGFNEEVMETCC